MSRLSPSLLTDLPDAPVCVGFSGGLDSSVLLHLLAALPEIRERGLRAWHVHHGLQAQADDWAAHCRAACAALSVPLTVSSVAVPRNSGLGLEGAARQARRAAFAAGIGAGEVLALAHHRDDQAETFLLRALRGSGPDGLAAMRPWREFGRGHLWRPLLDHPRGALAAYAAAHGLRWIEDPSNSDASFDRNFLRKRVLPLLRDRWPHADAALAGSAALCSQAAGLLDDDDAQALAGVATDDPHILSRPGLRALPTARRARVLRRWIASLQLPPLPASGIACIESELLDARADAGPRFAWHGAVVQAWRDLLHADVQRAPLPGGWQTDWNGDSPLTLPTGDLLELVGGASAPARDRDTGWVRFQVGAEDPGIRVGAGLPPMTWRVHARHGGERITLPGRDHSHALKHVLQDAAVPPWQRARLPLLSDADGELLAAGDRIISARLHAWLRERELHLHWRTAATAAAGN